MGYFTAGYIACGLIAFAFFCYDWHKDFGIVTVRNALYFAFLGLLGPIGLASACIVAVIGYTGRIGFMDKRLF